MFQKSHMIAKKITGSFSLIGFWNTLNQGVFDFEYFSNTQNRWFFDLGFFLNLKNPNIQF